MLHRPVELAPFFVHAPPNVKKIASGLAKHPLADGNTIDDIRKLKVGEVGGDAEAVLCFFDCSFGSRTQVSSHGQSGGTVVAGTNRDVARLFHPTETLPHRLRWQPSRRLLTRGCQRCSCCERCRWLLAGATGCGQSTDTYSTPTKPRQRRSWWAVPLGLENNDEYVIQAKVSGAICGRRCRR